MSLTPLNPSILTSFLPTTPIGTIINAMFIEEMNKTVSYENYFAWCAPIKCQYQKVTRNNVLYVATTVLSYYGGLSIALRFITWNGVIFYRWIKTYLRRCHATVQPFS